jgi:two-component system CheB/CheR fusion protein
VGRHISLIIPADRFAEEDRIIATLKAGQRIEHFDTVRLRRDGKPVLVSLTISPLKDEAGRVVGASKIARDVTERKRAEEELLLYQERLRQSEVRFRTFAENGPQMVWAVDANGVSQYLNSRWCDYTGLTAEETADPDKLRAVVHPDDYQRMMDCWAEALRTSTPYQVEFRLRRATDGEYRWFLCRGVPVRDDRRRIVQWIGANADIDDQKRAEDALVEADHRKDEFLATLAHELRNPLAPIRNALQVLRLSTDRAASEQARALMERQLDQMVRLVDDLLDMSRISRGKLELRRELVALATVVSSAVETSRPLIDHSSHELAVSLPDEPVIVDADLTRLAQVFSNLLNNSAKYTDRGGHIWLTARQQGDDVVVSVRDTGIGIPADQLSNIFRMFSQVDSALERAQGGLGIGLTLVKRLVELHDGQIEARSDGPGTGAEFVVRLPVAVGASATPSTREADELPAPKSSLRILIVDDSRDGADSLAMLLRLMGNDTRTAYDGQEGLEVAEGFRPDVMLLDIGLPKLNGYEACRAVREQPWGKSIVLIALTGWGQEEDRRRSRAAGFDHHMVKPVEPHALMKLLADFQLAAP